MPELKEAKVESGGNTRPDAAWFEEVYAAGELYAPDESTRPEAFLYRINYQWEGFADELNEDFFEAFRRDTGPNARRCNGTAYVRDQSGMYIVDCEWERLKRPCLSRPARGTVICHAHGAKIPQVQAAAQRALAEASEVVALRLIGMTDGDVEDKVKLAAINSVLDRAGIRGGLEVEVQTPGYKKVLERMFGAGDDDGE